MTPLAPEIVYLEGKGLKMKLQQNIVIAFFQGTAIGVCSGAAVAGICFVLGSFGLM